jgi:ABC-type multidrug transport system, ATPase component
MAVIEDVCDRVIVMADGRIVADSDVETLVETVGGERLQIKSNDLTHSIVSKLRERIEETALTATIDSDPRIEVELSKVSLYELFNILEGSGVEIEDIQTVEVGLEEALIALTSAQSQANTQRQSEAVDRERKEAQSADGEIHTDNSQRSNRAETDVVRSQEHEL